MIHPTAIIHESAEIDSSVAIGPYTVIGPKVKIGANTKIASHVVINGPTTIGENNSIYQFASVGEVPQDKKYDGEETELIIGNNNELREYCTINLGTKQGGGKTVIGNYNLLMAGIHVAHDCILGDNIVMVNNATIAGHVIIDNHAHIGAFIGIHQFCHVGSHSFITQGAMVTKDVPPFVTVAGTKAKTFGINSEGLKRKGYDEQTINNVKQAYRLIYRTKLSQQEALEEISQLPDEHGLLSYFVEFIEKSERGICR